MADSVVLHLTDLHFGWEAKDAQSRKNARKNCLDSLRKRLARIVKEDAVWKPTIVAITGDIGWGGIASDYEEAKKWLDEVLRDLQLGYDRVVVCPGNHDINRKAVRLLARPDSWKEADEYLQVPIDELYLKGFEAFSNFCKSAGIRAYDFAGSKSFLVGKTSFDGLDVIALNSAWYCRGDSDRSNLWIGRPHLQQMQSDGQIRLVEEESGNPVLTLIHHPKDWLNENETNSYDNRPNVWDVLARRCHLILNGHTHGEVRKADRFAEGAWHLTGGSGFAGDSHFNSFRLIRIGRNGFDYRSYEFDPRSAEGSWSLKLDSDSLSFGKPSQATAAASSSQTTVVSAGYVPWLKQVCTGGDLLGVRSQEARAVKIAQVYVPLITNRRSGQA